MRDEPYRWIEAIQDRRDYIEDQLRLGSPVVGLGYNDGMVLVTLSRGQRKIFEVHDRIALSAIGHPADIEQLRMLVTDTASVQGFQNATADVNLHRLTHFVLAHTFKQAFESIVGEAYIIKMLLAELGSTASENRWTLINYDGNVQTDVTASVMGGTDAIEARMKTYLMETANLETLSSPHQDRPLAAALQVCLKTWAVGRDLSLREGDTEIDADTVSDAQLRDVINEALDTGEIEAGVLEKTQSGPSKFRRLGTNEIEPALDEW